VQIRFFNYPIPENREDLHEGGFFVQDNWKIAKHLTVNVGLRFDDFATFIPAQTKPAGAFGPPWVAPAGSDPNLFPGGAQQFPRIGTGAWRNVAPRAGLAWDISGHGKTVLKAAFGRYNWTPGDDFASSESQHDGCFDLPLELDHDQLHRSGRSARNVRLCSGLGEPRSQWEGLPVCPRRE
jgi:outer membrane receptor protein involved in Fe transport